MPERLRGKDPEVQFDRESGTAHLYRSLGPGLITGAADDDPSGVATYSQAGAQFGYSFGWTTLLTFPLMTAIQIIAGRIGRTTGLGLAGVFRQHFSPFILNGLVALLFIANVVNLGADLTTMADASARLSGIPKVACLLAFTAFCIFSEIFLPYSYYVRVLKWLTLSLLAYVATLAFVHVDWGEFALRLVYPDLPLSREFLTTLVAVFGTTISPYLLFWQASEEAEDVRVRRRRQPLTKKPKQAKAAIGRISMDTIGGMAFSNLVALAIMTTAAAALHTRGITEIKTASDAAEALRPLAGDGAFALFTLGIVGTGLLAVPVLAGSAAYALGEAREWRAGLAYRPREAPAFYITVAVATLAGMLVEFAPLDPIRALYWSAVINGLIVVPVMAAMMTAATRTSIMGSFVVRGWVLVLGWLATAVMALAALTMIAYWIV